MKKPLTPAQKNRIAERVRAGESPTEVAKSAGISKNLLYRILHQFDVPRKEIRITSVEQTQNIIKRYLAGESAYSLSQETGMHVQTVYNILKRAQVPLQIPHKRLVEKDRAIIAAQGGSVPTKILAERFGISQETVFRIMREFDVELPQGRPRIYEVDETAFDTITPESAYWMGMLFADGCLHYKGSTPRIILALSERDQKHVELFRSFLKSTYPIRVGTVTDTMWGDLCVYHTVRSWRMAVALATRGLVVGRPFPPVPELANSPDFWRGAVDGDGWLAMSDNYPYIGLSGQHPLLEAFQKFLISNGLASLNIVATTSGVWKIGTSSSTAKAIIEKLYSSATSSTVLARKNVRAQAIINGDMRKSEPYTEGPAKREWHGDEKDYE